MSGVVKNIGIIGIGHHQYYTKGIFVECIFISWL